MYFLADDGLHGRELFVSDGTAAGTRLVRDIRPGVSVLDQWREPVEVGVIGDVYDHHVDEQGAHLRPTGKRARWADNGEASTKVISPCFRT